MECILTIKTKSKESLSFFERKASRNDAAKSLGGGALFLFLSKVSGEPPYKAGSEIGWETGVEVICKDGEAIVSSEIPGNSRIAALSPNTPLGLAYLKRFFGININ